MHSSLFWELFIPGAKGCLNTYGINADIGLANGTEIKYHSLSFEHQKDERNLMAKLNASRPGDSITIDEPPTAINVELFADFPEDLHSDKSAKVDARAAWLGSGKGSITADGKVVIPISLQDGSIIPFRTEHIPGCNEPGRFYKASQIKMKDCFPIEPAFAVTVDKAQVSAHCCACFEDCPGCRPQAPMPGACDFHVVCFCDPLCTLILILPAGSALLSQKGKTMHRIILSVSEHLYHLNRMTWEGLYVALSRVRMGDHMRLLIKRGDWNTVAYVDKLRKNKYTDWFFRGYEAHPANDGTMRWNCDLAKKAAGLDKKVKFGEKRVRATKRSNKNARSLTHVRPRKIG